MLMVAKSMAMGHRRPSLEAAMAKLASIIWIVLGITIAGAFGVAVLSIPSLSANAARLLPLAALAGFVCAIPASILVARRILAETAGH
jgi:hypothetical protein